MENGIVILVLVPRIVLSTDAIPIVLSSSFLGVAIDSRRLPLD